MKYLGNCQEAMPVDLRQRILDTPGQAYPRDRSANSDKQSSEYGRAIEAGYDLTRINWWVYTQSDLGPIELPYEDYSWWIVKLDPGHFMPMHVDHRSECKRLWIPLQDYEPGHVFIYKSELIKDYRAYDVFEYEHEQDYHGSANIGYTPRVVLQVVLYNT